MRIRYADPDNLSVIFIGEGISGRVDDPRIAERIAEYLADGGTIDPADPPPTPVRYLTKRTIASRLKAMGKYVPAFEVVQQVGALQDWNDAQDIQADPPDPQVAQILGAVLTAEEIAEVLKT